MQREKDATGEGEQDEAAVKADQKDGRAELSGIEQPSAKKNKSAQHISGVH